MTRPPLLWLHGLACRGRDVLDSLPSAGLEFRVLAPDLPGLSPLTAESTFTPERLADTLADVLADDGIDRCHLLGHSAGFLVADALVRRHPGLAIRLLCLEGNLTADDCFLTEKLRDAGADQSRLLIQQFTEDPDPSLKLWGGNLQRMNPRFLARTAAEIVRCSASGSALQALLEFNGAAHYLHGDHQDPPAGIRDSQIPCTSIPGCGHFPYLDNPEGFWRQLSTILTVQDPS